MEVEANLDSLLRLLSDDAFDIGNPALSDMIVLFLDVGQDFFSKMMLEIAAFE